MSRRSWPVRRLEEITTFISGGTPETSREDYWNGEIPWITAKDMKSIWLRDAQLNITEAGAKASCRVVSPGTVLVLVRGMTLLKDVPIGVTTRPAAFNQDVKGLAPAGCVLPEYLALALTARKPQLLRLVSQAGHGTGVLSSEQLACVRLPIADADYQRRVVDVVRLCEDEERLLSTQIRQLKRRLGGLRHKLLEFHDSGKGPKIAWKSARIGDVLTSVERRVRCEDSERYRLVSVRRRSEGVFFREELSGRDIKTKDIRRIHAGDFLISRRQIVHGAAGVVPDAYDGMFVSSSYAVLAPIKSGQISVRYLNQLSKTAEFHRLARMSSHGVHIEKLFFDLRDFLRRRIKLPESVRDQERIADTLDLAEREIALLAKQGDLLFARKTAVIHALLAQQQPGGGPHA
jgi:type I restriction enzyme, S subunit